MIINRCKSVVIFTFVFYLVPIYCNNEDEAKQEESEDLIQHTELRIHLKTVEKMVHDILSCKTRYEDYEHILKSLLNDYITLLIETVTSVRKNETDGFDARDCLIRQGGPIFLNKFTAYRSVLTSNSSSLNTPTGGIAVIVKQVQDLYNKIVKLGSTN